MRTVTEITNNPNLKYTLIGTTSDGVHFYKEEVNTEFYKHKELSQKQREQIIKEKINNWEQNIAIKKHIEYELPEVIEEEIIYKLPEVVEDKQIEISQERREEMLQEAISNWGNNIAIKKHIEYELPEVIEEVKILHEDYAYTLNVDVMYKNIKVINEHTGEVNVYKTTGIPSKVILNKNILTYDDFIEENKLYINYTINVDTGKLIGKRLIESNNGASMSWDTGSVSRTIEVEDTIAPVVTLIGSSSINVECGTSYNEEGAIALDDCDGVLSVTVGGDTVDVSVTGTYVVTYSATDSSGNTGSVSRTVVVEDTIAPVVTLIGSSTINIETDDTYNEQGAIALDQCDGTLSVTVGGDTVDVTTLGTYTVGYSATDSSGNTGTNSRTVVVSEVSIPCGGQNSYSGSQGTFNYDINLGTATGGTSTLSYKAYNIPDRFVVTHGGVVVIDTGFVGTFYPSSLRALDGIYGAGNWVQGGPGAGTASFVKTSADNIATVTVYGPLPSTAFEFVLSCPV
jgi:hypothetical protein